MTFAQRRNRLTTHFSERIPVVKRRISVFTRIIPVDVGVYGSNLGKPDQLFRGACGLSVFWLFNTVVAAAGGIATWVSATINGTADQDL